MYVRIISPHIGAGINDMTRIIHLDDSFDFYWACNMKFSRIN